jgi:hypothetical protein
VTTTPDHAGKIDTDRNSSAPRPQYPFPQTAVAHAAFRALVRATQFSPPVNRQERRPFYYDTRWIVENEEGGQ